MEDKKIEDYLHLYLGCECLFDNKVKGVINHKLLSDGLVPQNRIKPILRLLSDMSEEDKVHYWGRGEFDPIEFLWLLKEGFDLFGLIDAGLAIDLTTLKI